MKPAKSKEYKVTTVSDGKQLTQYFSHSSLFELLQTVITSHYLWETVPVRKITLKPGGDQWTKW